MISLTKTLALLGMVSLLFASGKISVLQSNASLTAPVQALKIEVPVNATVLNSPELLDQQIDTLKNDNGTPYYYWNPPTAIFAARLTPIAPCTLQYLVFMKYRKVDTLDPTVCGCSLFVWKDTVIGGQHQPGRLLLYGYARDSLPRSPYNAYWIWYNLSAAGFRLGADHFWTGYRWLHETGGGADPTDTLWALSDNGVSEPDRNAAALTSAGPWELLSYGDFMIRAVVKREPSEVHDIEVLWVDNSQGFFLPIPGNATISGLIKNSGTVPENNFPVACTVYNSAGVAVYNSTVTVPYLDVNRDTVISFTPNWTPNTEGLYLIAVRSLLSGDARPTNDRWIREAQVCSSPAELRYDDGEADNAWAFYRAGNGWANKFTPPYYPCKLTAVKYYLWGSDWPVPGGNQMTVRVLDDDGEDGFPGTVLYEATVTITRGQYNTIDLPTPLTFNSGSFYVAYIQADTWINSPGLACDEDAPFAFERYIFYQDTWYYEPDYADWMIRAVVERVGAPPGAGWARKADLTGNTKPAKGGGGITARGDTVVYCIPGNNTLDFMRYSVSANSWTKIEPGVPVGPKNKKVKKGAYIVDTDRADKGIEGEVYIFKGGGTQEFYKYDPQTKGWESLPQPNFIKGVKGGFATFVELTKGEDYLYVGSGSNTNEWKRYKISTREWEPITPSLPVEKAKVGSGLAWDGGNKIYFLLGGGKTNTFQVFDLTSSSWTPKPDLPLTIPNTTRKKKVKEGGAIEFFDGKVYAVKGGNTKQFWFYEPNGDSWHYVGEVGDGWPVPPAKGIKCGRSLTSTSTGIYCLIGNNTNEFWFYGGGKSFKTLEPAVMGKTTLADKLAFAVIPNPTKGLTQVYYSLPKKEMATLKVYNTLGELVYSSKTDKGHFTIGKLPTGVYLLRFETKGYKEERKLIVLR